MTKKEVTVDVQNAISTLNKRMGKAHGASVYADLSDRTKSDPSAAQYQIGDELFVDDNVDNLFMQMFNGRKTTGVVCAAKDAAGNKSAKSLYFSALDRTIPEYGADLQATGNLVSAKTEEIHDVFDAVQNCATEQEIYDLLKGKSLKVAAINKVLGARYNSAGQISGTRERKIPVFTFA